MVNLAVLRNSIDKGIVREFWKAAIFSGNKSPKSCPGCELNLIEFSAKSAVPDINLDINLDICKNCQLVWFDPGELEQLPGKNNTYTSNELEDQFEQAVAIAKVKLGAEEREFAKKTELAIEIVITLLRIFARII
jgi:Zn-finger nucleic acid-binding protein